MSTETGLATQTAFPTAEIEACIRGELSAQAATQAVLQPQAAPAWEPQIDSLVVVEVICKIEELLGVRLPTSFAPRGGYHSVDECVTDLLAQTKSVWVDVAKEGADT